MKSSSQIKIEDLENFCPRHIFCCGQVFRFREVDGGYEIYSKDKRAVVFNEKILCDDIKYWHNYFDLSKNYDIIIDKLKGFSFLDGALTFGKGLRILRQDKFETIISFLISQNNNISRIKRIIERLCVGYGEEMDGFFAFPTAKKLSSVRETDLLSLGLGYRAPYILDTARAIESGFDIDGIDKLSEDEAAAKLMTLKGIGPKVADCILLFGYHKMAVFPIDTWIFKAARDLFAIESGKIQQVRERLISKFGNLSGYAQQYIYYYKRENKDKI